MSRIETTGPKRVRGQASSSVEGAPIVSTECLCADCRKAGAFLQALPGAPTTLDANLGGRCQVARLLVGVRARDNQRKNAVGLKFFRYARSTGTAARGLTCPAKANPTPNSDARWMPPSLDPRMNIAGRSDGAGDGLIRPVNHSRV